MSVATQSARGQRPSWYKPAGIHRISWVIMIFVVFMTIVGMVLLWPQGDSVTKAAPDKGSTVVKGEVLAVQPIACPPSAPGTEASVESTNTICGTVSVRLADGPDTGKTISTKIPSGPGAAIVESGDTIVLLHMPDSMSGETYSIIDHQRSFPLALLGAIFALTVLAFGKWRGLASLVGLAITFAILLMFIVPSILDGHSPVIVAIVGATAIMLTVLYLTHGFSMTTTIAVAGTLVSLTMTIGLSSIAIAAIHLSGVTDDSSLYLTATNSKIDMQGLLMASIVIGSLGVLDDVTITQSVTVSELSQANPSYRFHQLYSAASRVGKAHITSIINTIVLAYAGASMPLMLLIATSNTSISELVTGQYISQEFVRSAVGTLGLIAAVPITTALAAAVVHIAVSKPPLDVDAPSTRIRRSSQSGKHHSQEPWMSYFGDD